MLLKYKIYQNTLSPETINNLENAVLNENTQWIFNRYAAYKNPAYLVSEETKRSITSFRHSVFQNGKMLYRDMYDLFK